MLEVLMAHYKSIKKMYLRFNQLKRYLIENENIVNCLYKNACTKISERVSSMTQKFNYTKVQLPSIPKSYEEAVNNVRQQL